MMNKKGFTMIELVIYLAVVSVILLAVSGFLYSMIKLRVKNQVINEVESQGVQAMEIITQQIRQSAVITNPTDGNTDTSLTVDGVVFDLSGGILREDGVELTNNKVEVTDLSFLNLSNSVKIEYTINYINLGEKGEYNQVKTFYGTASLRQ